MTKYSFFEPVTVMRIIVLDRSHKDYLTFSFPKNTHFSTMLPSCVGSTRSYGIHIHVSPSVSTDVISYCLGRDGGVAFLQQECLTFVFSQLIHFWSNAGCGKCFWENLSCATVLWKPNSKETFDNERSPAEFPWARPRGLTWPSVCIELLSYVSCLVKDRFCSGLFAGFVVIQAACYFEHCAQLL